VDFARLVVSLDLADVRVVGGVVMACIGIIWVVILENGLMLEVKICLVEIRREVLECVVVHVRIVDRPGKERLMRVRSRDLLIAVFEPAAGTRSFPVRVSSLVRCDWGFVISRLVNENVVLRVAGLLMVNWHLVSVLIGTVDDR